MNELKICGVRLPSCSTAEVAVQDPWHIQSLWDACMKTGLKISSEFKLGVLKWLYYANKNNETLHI